MARCGYPQLRYLDEECLSLLVTTYLLDSSTLPCFIDFNIGTILFPEIGNIPSESVLVNSRIVGAKSIKPIGSILYGIVFGIAGLVIWCVCMVPFLDYSSDPWTRTEFFFKLFTASLIVPVFEELFIRGYILRFAFQWNVNRQNNKIDSPLNETLDHSSINDVKPGAWSLMAIGISTIAFTAGHMPVQWLAAVAYSILISILWIIRKDLLSCMVAHGITNFTLALYVYFTGQWGFW